MILDPVGSYVAAFEMKRWVSPAGNVELPSIRTDLAKLGGMDCAIKGQILFSFNARGEHAKHIEWLEIQIPELKAGPQSPYVFDTVDKAGVAIEFWMGLWLL